MPLRAEYPDYGMPDHRQHVESVNLPTSGAQLASGNGCAALVQHWRDCAKSIASHYWKLRAVAPDAAERAKARSETYADCANQLEEAMRHNEKLRDGATKRRPSSQET